MATIRPYRPRTSAKMRIRIIPTNSLEKEEKRKFIIEPLGNKVGIST